MIKRVCSIILILASFTVFSYSTSFSAENCNIVSVVYSNGVSDNKCIDKEKLVEMINEVQKKGGGYIKLGPGIFILKNPIILRNNVQIEGTDKFTILKFFGNIAFTQNEDEILDSIIVKNLQIEISTDKEFTVFHLHGHTNCIFENIKITSNPKTTVFFIEPKGKAVPPRNAVFNTYRNIYVTECGKCVIYNGDGIPPKEPFAVISNNVWENIIFRKVYIKAIEAIKWVDSEKWYNLYAQAFDENVILIDLNLSRDTWMQVDRFHFYSPTLVYTPQLKKSKQKPIAIRLGKGVAKVFVKGVITDKIWDNFLIDDGATSYYVEVDSSGIGNILKNLEMIIYKKNIKFYEELK